MSDVSSMTMVDSFDALLGLLTSYVFPLVHIYVVILAYHIVYDLIMHFFLDTSIL